MARTRRQPYTKFSARFNPDVYLPDPGAMYKDYNINPLSLFNVQPRNPVNLGLGNIPVEWFEPGVMEEILAGKRGQLKETPPKTTGTGAGNGLDPYTIAQLGVDIGAPIAYDLLTGPKQRNAFKRQQVNLEIPELMAGQVEGIPKPSFALSSIGRDMGSSLAERNAVNQFRNAFQKDKETQFALQNSASKIGQRNAVRDRLNQIAQVKSGIRNQEELANAQMAHREYLMRMQDQTSTYESLFGNVTKDLGQLGYLASARKLAMARDILMNPSRYGGQDSPLYKQAYSRIEGLLMTRGGKLKTKLSS